MVRNQQVGFKGFNLFPREHDVPHEGADEPQSLGRRSGGQMKKMSF